MQIKQVEIRDAHTFIPTLAILVSGYDGYLMRRAGFGSVPCVQLVHILCGKTAYDPYDWDNRTMQVAHNWIATNWDALKDTGVVDVQFILGETTKPKLSEEVPHAQ